jgi:hypothetical protein
VVNVLDQRHSEFGAVIAVQLALSGDDRCSQRERQWPNLGGSVIAAETQKTSVMAILKTFSPANPHSDSVHNPVHKLR